MASFDECGLIDAHGDPAQAGAHLMTLVSTEIVHRSYWGVIPLPREEVSDLITAGVRAFLRAYSPEE